VGIDFNPEAKAIFRENQRSQIVASDIGIVLWLGAMGAFWYYQGFLEMFRVYFVPYLWLVVRILHCWLVLMCGAG
jgi:omega-6 fatty acid desaturase (delta-12 desaturase)